MTRRLVAAAALALLAGCGADGAPEPFEPPAPRDEGAAPGPRVDLSGTATIGVSGTL